MKRLLVALLLAVPTVSVPALGQVPTQVPADVAPPPPPMDDAPPAPPPDDAPAPPKENTAKQQTMSPPDAWEPRTAATLRVMNKIDSTVQTLSIAVGGSVNFQSLTIRVSGCYVRPADLPADATAHLTITDSRPDQPGFDAWMLKNEPALNMLEHPVYDVQLAGCA